MKQIKNKTKTPKTGFVEEFHLTFKLSFNNTFILMLFKKKKKIKKQCGLNLR